ncbi:MAG: hypothetical protein QGF68_09110 [Nitrospinota bacterium]|jgi:anti-sigma factor RsiW|nr:hypothetical protein [Nitrospinota bacterium]
MDFEAFKRSVNLYLDGELDSASTVEFEKWVETDPRCGAILEREEKLRLLIREELSKDKAPDTLRAGVLRDIRRNDRASAKTHFTGWRAAAAVLLAVLIGGGFYFRYDNRDLTRIVEGSIRSHRIYSRGGDLIDFRAADERALLPKMQERVRFAMALPSLTRNDLEMVGGPVCVLIDRQAALTFYRKGDNRLSLFTLDKRNVRLPNWGGKEIDGRVVHFLESGNYRVAVWKDGKCVYSLVARLEERDLSKYLAAGFKEVVTRSN